ncbi:aminoacyl-tRNA hydrolase [Campylobacter sp. FMV-PI01]|uniref:Peptidyl-tRNA hydrolase n=1 Tax=Campylobacter portucalensis TaxID=2608384 RepID=A0A6L5WFL5_9BACT|nr:aminoacyl-tRNA hydrolase [Campylobacter portucalensis]MSN95659.1 aminoacyl-tRNA hydrolase [Campylobacter portucalensis]
MILIVGLGNIGSEYNLTRHNVGFMLIDIFKDGKFINISQDKFKGELYKNSSLLLLKPSTFMNLSGISVKAVKDFYKPDRIIVIHDDLDLKFGSVKFKKGGSSGGHNGIKSIDSLIGSDYERVRIGIGRGQSCVKNYVLGKFKEDEILKLEKILNYTKNAINELIKSDIDKIKAKFNINEIK